MSIKKITLDGEWEFLHAGSSQIAKPIQIRRIQVPGPWQAQFDGLRMKAGIGIYRRWIDVPPGQASGRIYLRFGAVFHNTKAWVNGVPVGEHEGGFLPFSFDVTEQIHEGRNEIKVRAESPTDNPAAFPSSPLAEIPFGKQSWYGPLSGIWQSLWLEWRGADHIDHVRVCPDMAAGRVGATVFFKAALLQPAEIDFTVMAPSGAEAARLTLSAQRGAEELTAHIDIPDIMPWSPDAPNLYSLSIALRRGREAVDETGKTFGFRCIETREGRFYLNGKALYLRAALDQDYYPDTICTPPSVAYIEDQFRKAKELGLNCLRCHIKAPDPRYYEAADRAGLLIWTELPNGGVSTERSRSRKEALLKGIVDRDGHHPSIVIWTIINENWGVDLVNDAEHRAWLKRTYHWLKAYDPSRLVVDNSPLSPSFHVETDIADYHFYAAIPDSRRAWDDFVERLAGRGSFLFSTEGDAVVTGQEPVLCSEFGNWGLPDPADLRDAAGREPWWFETGHDWGEGVMYAHGVENRFTDWSLDRIFGTLRGFTEAAQWQQFRALKYQIEAMRRKPALAGYVITEFTDVHWESNGLLDMRRNPRVFHHAFHAINSDTVILASADKSAYWAGDKARLSLALAHGAGERLAGTELEVTFASEARKVTVPPVDAGEVAELGEIEIALPAASSSQVEPATLKLFGSQGEVLASNAMDVAVYSRAEAEAEPKTAFWSPDPDLCERVTALGYPMAESLAAGDLVVARRHDAELAAFVRGGGRLLLLTEDEDSLYPFFPHWQNVRVVRRRNTLWQGDWASSFSWLDRKSAFADIPGGPLIDGAFDRVIPHHVISGCNLLDFQGRVHAGIVVGWIHKPAALIVERGYGKGRIVASTFRLFVDPPGADPTATVLLRCLTRLAVKPPVAEAKPDSDDMEDLMRELQKISPGG